MSGKPIPSGTSVPTAGPGGVAPTPQNTPLPGGNLTTAMSKPTVPTVAEGEEDDGEDGPPETPPEGAAGLAGLDAKGRSAILGLVQQRLEGLVGQSSGYIDSLPSGTKKRVLALKGVQADWEKELLVYKKECLELERKFAARTQPLLERRLALISGTTKPTPEELQKGHDQEVKDHEEFSDSEDEGEEEEEAEATEKFLPSDPIVDSEPGATGGIPQFWLTTLRNHQGLAELITDRDEKALEFLTNIKLLHLDPANPLPDTEKTDDGKGKMGFRLTFTFDENPFFEGTTLEKTYYYLEELGYEGDFIFSHAVGTEIKWKGDQDLTKEIEIKKQRNKHSGKTRLVRKAKTVPSFFDFFSPPTPPTDAQMESGELDEDELEELDTKLEMDYTIGEDLKEKIIPRAIDYFTGKALRYELDDEDFDEDDEEEEYEDDDDEEDDDDDDDDDEPPRRTAKKKGGPRSAGTGKGTGGDGPGECKQQ